LGYETEKFSMDQIEEMAKNLEAQDLKTLEEAFWEWFPHEIGWAEMKECNSELYEAMRAIGQFLIANGLMEAAYVH
jgi:exonuclease VII small subunit